MRKTEKNRKNVDNCRASGLYFQPLVVETFEGWDPGAVKMLKTIAIQCAPRKGLAPALEIKRFFQRLSVSLQLFSYISRFYEFLSRLSLPLLQKEKKVSFLVPCAVGASFKGRICSAFS